VSWWNPCQGGGTSSFPADFERLVFKNLFDPASWNGVWTNSIFAEVSSKWIQKELVPVAHQRTITYWATVVNSRPWRAHGYALGRYQAAIVWKSRGQFPSCWLDCDLLQRLQDCALKTLGPDTSQFDNPDETRGIVSQSGASSSNLVSGCSPRWFAATTIFLSERVDGSCIVKVNFGREPTPSLPWWDHDYCTSITRLELIMGNVLCRVETDRAIHNRHTMTWYALDPLFWNRSQTSWRLAPWQRYRRSEIFCEKLIVNRSVRIGIHLFPLKVVMSLMRVPLEQQQQKQVLSRTNPRKVQRRSQDSILAPLLIRRTFSQRYLSSPSMTYARKFWMRTIFMKVCRLLWDGWNSFVLTVWSA
jgi:hypothetical protein